MADVAVSWLGTVLELLKYRAKCPASAPVAAADMAKRCWRMGGDMDMAYV